MSGNYFEWLSQWCVYLLVYAGKTHWQILTVQSFKYTSDRYAVEYFYTPENFHKNLGVKKTTNLGIFLILSNTIPD